MTTPNKTTTETAAKEDRLRKQRKKLLWCVHILGPDELVAFATYEEAEAHAQRLIDYLYDPTVPEHDVLCLPIVALWPWSAEAHAAEIDKARTRDDDDECNLRMSYYGTCARGTRGCSAMHKETKR